MTIIQQSQTRSIFLYIFFLALFPVISVFIMQFGFDLKPCVLCHYQRYPYFLILFLSLCVLIFNVTDHKFVFIAFMVCVLCFFITAFIGFFHVGVEHHWWEGTAECAGRINIKLSPQEFILQLTQQPIVRCDEVAWSFLGISLAGYNFLYGSCCGIGLLYFGIKKEYVTHDHKSQ
ncbi:MAG: disulfide bond formation protein B [Alphaproteobacteria bacterium]|nr:disulfide bond formation protein B [Alphaproteobacteria bacterium]